MANPMFLEDGPRGWTSSPFLRSASVKDVSYSCGSCGYELNLSSLNQNMSTIGTKYRKSIKKGIISFWNVDESRFTLVDELQCTPYFLKQSWSLFRRRTKLLCRKCGNCIGIGYDRITSSDLLVSDGVASFSSSEAPSQRKYESIKGKADAIRIMRLYHHPYSLDSQKVRLALEEKGIDYTSFHLNLITGKNLRPSFFRMNPTAKLPVFQNGSHFIFDTMEIIQSGIQSFSHCPTSPRSIGKECPSFSGES